MAIRAALRRRAPLVVALRNTTHGSGILTQAVERALQEFVREARSASRDVGPIGVQLLRDRDLATATDDDSAHTLRVVVVWQSERQLGRPSETPAVYAAFDRLHLTLYPRVLTTIKIVDAAWYPTSYLMKDVLQSCVEDDEALIESWELEPCCAALS